jgi:transposase
MRLSRDRRNKLVRSATEEGHSRRDLAKLLDVSFARIQQLVRDE